MQKVKVGIIGTGNVGTDLLIKVRRSKYLECIMFAGIRESEGVKRARKLGVPVSIESITAIIKSDAEVVYDCTTAKAHFVHAPLLVDRFVVDLTPSRIGVMCVPLLGLPKGEQEVNLTTCGGQAMTPLAKAIMDVHPECEYMEIISTLSSKSAGMGTRNNIDEFTQTTAKVLEELAGVKKAKAIIILNPAEPPVTMQNTLYTLISKPNIRLLRQSVKKVVSKIKQYVPGYELVVEPTLEKEQGRITTTIKCLGRGDFLPKYAGNLDIITTMAVVVGEEYAKNKNN